MTNFYTRQAATYRNDLKRSLGALLGIAQGLLADRQLNDEEIRFLDDWLGTNDVIATTWPGDVVYARVKAALADGVISDSERTHLVDTLQKLVGGTLDELAESTHVTSLAFDDVPRIEFPGILFCLTGDFVFGPRNACEATIERRGGLVSKSVTKKLRYLVVGGLGSAEWKHGSFGTKLEKAMDYKREGVGIFIVHEDKWTSSLREA
jgi:NAD-dependent DNA ligase